jgi:hypothetical protein
MGLLAPPPRERVELRRLSLRSWVLVLGGLGWVVSEAMYAFAIVAVLGQSPTEFRRGEKLLYVGLGTGLVLLHLLCLTTSAKIVLRDLQRGDRVLVTVMLAALWFVCGGWISPAAAYFVGTTGYHDFKVGPQLKDLPYVLGATIPLLSVIACCLAAWLGTRRRSA